MTNIDRILSRTPVAHRCRFVVVADEETNSLTLRLRAEVAQHLKQNDLGDLARLIECRQVAPGALLVMQTDSNGTHVFTIGGEPGRTPGRPRGRTTPRWRKA